MARSATKLALVAAVLAASLALLPGPGPTQAGAEPVPLPTTTPAANSTIGSFPAEIAYGWGEGYVPASPGTRAFVTPDPAELVPCGDIAMTVNGPTGVVTGPVTCRTIEVGDLYGLTASVRPTTLPTALGTYVVTVTWTGGGSDVFGFQITSDGPVTPVRRTITVAPSQGLLDGDRVQVGSVASEPWPASTPLLVVQCASVSTTGCDLSTRVDLTTSSAGAFTVPFRVSRTLAPTSGGSVDCAVNPCYVVVSDAQNRYVGSAAIALGAPPVTATAPSTTTTVPTAPTCEPRVTFGIGVADSSCFVKGQGVYRTTELVRLNGMELRPVTGAVVKIDPATRRIWSEGDVRFLLGGVEVPTGVKIDWTLPTRGGTWTIVPPVEFSGVPIAGISVQGSVRYVLTDGASNLGFDVKLPEPFPSGGFTVSADNERGLRLSEARVRVPIVRLGAFTLKNVGFTYSQQVADGRTTDTLTAGGTLVLFAGAAISARVVVANGGLQELSASYDDPTGLVVGPGVFLNRAALDYVAAPARFTGTATITVGPSFYDFPGVARLTGSFCAGQCNPDPAAPPSYTASGGADFIKWRVGTLDFRLVPQQIAELAGRMDVSLNDPVTNTRWISATADVAVWFARTDRWDAEGTGDVCVLAACARGQLLVSSVGMGAYVKVTGLPSVTVRTKRVCVPIFGCVDWPEKVEVTPGEICVGGGYEWATGSWSVGAACDLSRFRPVKPSAGIATTESVTVPVVGEGRQYEVFRIEGDGAVPDVTVSGPGGRRITGSADPNAYLLDQTTGSVVLNDPSADASYVFVALASAGDWTVAAADGSVAITQVATAHSLPDPAVRGTVTGSGTERVLEYETRLNPGQRVQLVEQGTTGAVVIGATDATDGRIRFTPSPGPAGERTVVAMISEDGGLVRAVDVTTFVADAAQPLPAPSRLRTMRTGGRVKASWKRVPGATRYWLVAELDDGRRFEQVVRRTQARLPRSVTRADRGRLVVTAVSPAGVDGTSATATLGKRARQ